MAGAKILQKIVFEGTLQLDSPLLIGSGTETEQRTNEADIHILKDKLERPFIPGTSLAGVLRAWMEGQDEQAARKIFGFITKKQNSESGQEQKHGGIDLQSAIAVSDVILQNATTTVRDGVHIDPYTGVGIEGHKYDYEAVERGAKGNLYIVLTAREFLAHEIPDLEKLCKKLADRLYTGIRVGALTAKGFGLVSVPDITIDFYNFQNEVAVKNWLLKQHSAIQYKGQKSINIANDTFVVDAEFALRSSLLIRDQATFEIVGSATLAAMPMKSGEDYLIPGTSVKGVLRHQAVKIMDILKISQTGLDDLMGYTKDETHETSKKGRFTVNEVYIKNDEDLVHEVLQTRNHIDRFTGGTIESALFTNRVLWQRQQYKPIMKIHYEIKDCKEWEAGLALYLLKDLWTGKITIGGEKSIGRGMLQGITAAINFGGKQFEIKRKEEGGVEKLIISSSDYENDTKAQKALEELAKALVDKKEAAEA